MIAAHSVQSRSLVQILTKKKEEKGRKKRVKSRKKNK